MRWRKYIKECLLQDSLLYNCPFVFEKDPELDLPSHGESSDDDKEEDQHHGNNAMNVTPDKFRCYNNFFDEQHSLNFRNVFSSFQRPQHRAFCDITNYDRSDAKRSETQIEGTAE